MPVDPSSSHIDFFFKLAVFFPPSFKYLVVFQDEPDEYIGEDDIKDIIEVILLFIYFFIFFKQIHKSTLK